MAQFLSDAWVAELDAAARRSSAPSGVQLCIQQVVLEQRGTSTTYALTIEDGQIRVTPGPAERADLTLTQDRATAREIARGDLSAQAAFMAGRLRVGGDLRGVIEHASELATLDDVFAAVRDATTW